MNEINTNFSFWIAYDYQIFLKDIIILYFSLFVFGIFKLLLIFIGKFIHFYCIFEY